MIKKKSKLISKIKFWLFLPLVITYANLMANLFFFYFYNYPVCLIKILLIVVSFLWVCFSFLYLISFNKALEEKFLSKKEYDNKKIKQFTNSDLEFVAIEDSSLGVVELKELKNYTFIDKYTDITVFIDIIKIAGFLITGGFISLLTVLTVLFSYS